MKSKFIQGFLSELVHMKKYPMIILIMIAITLIYPFVLSSLYEQNKVIKRPFALIDFDNSQLSRKITSNLNAAQGLDLTAKLYNENEAKEMLIERDVDMVVILQKDLSKEVKRGNPGIITVWSYTANILTYSTAYAALSETIMHLNSELGEKTVLTLGAGKGVAQASSNPIHPNIHLLFHPTLSYGEFLITGIFLIVFQQVLLIGLSFGAGLRRENEGIKALPTSLREAYGRASAQLPFYLFTATIILLFFDLYNWPLLTITAGIGLFSLFAVAVIPLGLLIATFMENQYSALSTLMFMSAPLLMISGFAMPLFAMPRYIQWIAMLFPTTPALAIMRMISNKSTNLSLIMPSIIHLLILTVAFMILLKIRILYSYTMRQRT